MTTAATRPKLVASDVAYAPSDKQPKPMISERSKLKTPRMPRKALKMGGIRMLSTGAKLQTICALATTIFAKAFTARAGTGQNARVSALRAHAKAPYKTDLLWETLRNAKDA